MFRRRLSVLGLMCLSLGCTSFRTTSLYRFANDSVAPQRTNQKLKGLPVKLKIPSHVHVVVHEQQVILANDPKADEDKKQAAAEATKAFQAQRDKVANVAQAVELTRKSRESAEATLQIYKASWDSAESPADKALAKDFFEKAEGAFLSAIEAEKKALLAVRNEPQERDDLEKKRQDMELKIKDSATGFVLVSFDPPQYIVETQLEYTDKIFLVDFKRPAGGILDLKNAKMDDQQYFSQVQADITERTIEDIGGALNTIKDPLKSLKPKAPNSAKPTSANTPEAEAKEDVHFQKSVVAVHRFDISEPGWEDLMMAFINDRLGSQNRGAEFAVPMPDPVLPVGH